MFTDQISDYFEGVAAKYLSAVDADSKRSNQHEIGGLSAAGFMTHLGSPNKKQEYRFKARQLYLADESVAPEVAEGVVTWYDCRRNQANRSAEYRLYYPKNSVTELLAAGDFFLIAKLRDGSLLMICTPSGGTVENQLRLIFGLDHVSGSFTSGKLNSVDLLLPLRLMLEDLGVEVNRVQAGDDVWLEKLIDAFGGKFFPTTSLFSDFARRSMAEEVSPTDFPDKAIVSWMDQEEKLFRIYERHLVGKKLREGFGDKRDDVDEFISYSLSVQNRRKSRVGHAFEGHLNWLFKANDLRFEQGRGKGFTTENNSRPDFLFPGFEQYRDVAFPPELLFMLGAKTTCKDRWRQVLSEAHRINNKHLITLEAAITEGQTAEMRSHGLQLVVPGPIQATYTQAQQEWLLGVADLIELVKFKKNI